jgi:Flp pilus assembly protein TadD
MISRRNLRLGFIALTAYPLLLACSSAPKTEPTVKGGSSHSSATVPNPVDPNAAAAASGGGTVVGGDGRMIDAKYANLSNALRSNKAQSVQDEAARILVANPDDLVALNALAMWNYRQKKVGAAKLLLARAIEKGEPRAAILNNYGLTLLAEGDEIGAAEQFKKALRLDESHAEANANLGAHYAKGGDWKKALPRLEAAWNAGRQDSTVANDYALALKGEGETEKARKIFEDAMKRNNKDSILLLNYAALLIETLNRPKEGLPLVYRVKFLETERKDVLTRANMLERKATSSSNSTSAP